MRKAIASSKSEGETGEMGGAQYISAATVRDSGAHPAGDLREHTLVADTRATPTF